MADKQVKGFPDSWGQHLIPLLDHSGPPSYVSGGEPIIVPRFGARSYAYIGSALSSTGTYRVECIYGGLGLRSQVLLKWTVTSTGQEVSNGTNLSAETVRLWVVSG